MKIKYFLQLLLLFSLFSSCKSININITEAGIPPSTVYFSFDDGPNAHDNTTERLLDILKKYKIRAQFCLLGENAENHPEIVKRIYNENHYIINHGYSDKWAVTMAEDEYRDNFIRGEKAISVAIGFDMNPKLYRPHGGFFYSSQEKICMEEGFIITPVTIRVYDAVSTKKNQSKIIEKIINAVENSGGGIILLHDARDSYLRMNKKIEINPDGAFNRSWIPQAVEELIISLLKKGYNLNGPDYYSIIGFEKNKAAIE